MRRRLIVGLLAALLVAVGAYAAIAGIEHGSGRVSKWWGHSSISSPSPTSIPARLTASRHPSKRYCRHHRRARRCNPVHWKSTWHASRIKPASPAEIQAGIDQGVLDAADTGGNYCKTVQGVSKGGNDYELLGITVHQTVVQANVTGHWCFNKRRNTYWAVKSYFNCSEAQWAMWFDASGDCPITSATHMGHGVNANGVAYTYRRWYFRFTKGLPDGLGFHVETWISMTRRANGTATVDWQRGGVA